MIDILHHDILDPGTSPVSAPGKSLVSNIVSESAPEQDRGVKYLLARAPRRPPAKFLPQHLNRPQSQEVDSTHLDISRDRRSSAPKAAFQILVNDISSSGDEDNGIHKADTYSHDFQRQTLTQDPLRYAETRERGSVQQHPFFRGRSLQNIHSSIPDFPQIGHDNQSSTLRRPVSNIQSSSVDRRRKPNGGLGSRIRASMPATNCRLEHEYFRASPSEMKSDSDARRSQVRLDRSPPNLDHDLADRQRSFSPPFQGPRSEHFQIAKERHLQRPKLKPSLAIERSPEDSVYAMSSDRFDTSFPGQVRSAPPRRDARALCELSSPLERLEGVFQAELQKRWPNHGLVPSNVSNSSSQMSINSRRYSGKDDEAPDISETGLSPTNISVGSENGEMRRASFAIFDDRVPFSIQPQTPADIKRHVGMTTPYTALIRRAPAGSSTNDLLEEKLSKGLEQLSITESHSSPAAFPRLSVPSPTPVRQNNAPSTLIASPVRHSIPSSPPRLTRGFGTSDPEKENAVEAEDLDAIHEERRTWHERGEASQGGVMNSTPPRVGRFERVMYQ
ncbi:MAG: hypothetical protein M1822_008314 [Bathelium mastoideum]|nr:MAG: hypothetical protein M1822_008314 [Bathelium mastoideum]